MHLRHALLMGLVIVHFGCKDEEQEMLAKADQGLPTAGAFVDALLDAQANAADAPACDGPVPMPTLLFTQERLDSLRAGTGEVSMHPAWDPVEGHPCHRKARVSDLQIVAHYRERKLRSGVKAIQVLNAVEDATECHAALKSFVVFRTDEVEAAKLTSEHSFDPGWAKGQLRVFEPNGSLRCATKVQIESDPEVSVYGGNEKEDKEQALKIDLELKLSHAAFEALGDAKLERHI
ncbi:hypothetical protein [Paraliomyxa miuraensis]|uniref:hypothetical protein n=1 Tax=Paraliomyxa miuraensis TaxID=376150 RepID=UPI00225B8DF5|nr:hypothetical protein [Paraliomyxa miuraensis]MCX4239573.1 hypothetical protein [Paraliomyxa miuraensis]